MRRKKSSDWGDREKKERGIPTSNRVMTQPRQECAADVKKGQKRELSSIMEINFHFSV